MDEKLKKFLLPLIFATVVSGSVLYCYHSEYVLPLSLLMFAFYGLVFILLDKLHSMKRLGGEIYILLIFGVTVLSSILVFHNERYFSLSFRQWFYTVHSADTFFLPYSVAIMFGGGFFVISVTYYFTQIIFRRMGNLLVLLIPIVIYSKREDTMPLISLLLIMASYVALCISESAQNEKYTKVIANRSYIFSVSLFIVFSTLLCAVIPKPKVVSQQEKNSNFLDTVLIENIGIGGNFSMFSTQSSANTGANYTSNRILFTVESEKILEKPLYLRRQCFDNYSGGHWNFSSGSFSNYNTRWDSFISKIYSETPFEAENNISEYSENNIKINPQNLPSVYVPAPLYTLSAVSENTGTGRTSHSEILLRNRNSNDHYSINYIQEKNLESDWTKNNLDKYLELSKNSFVSYDYAYAVDNFLNVDDEISEQVRELAGEITDGLTSDYEKAKAIEQYFTEQNFKYDLEFVPQETGVDYFLFNSKTGICSDFATAMTLLARSAGLPARYVEGFIVYEQSKDNPTIYNVREYHSHAFCEVYISGTGWTTFEPTVSGFMITFEDTSNPLMPYIQAFLKVMIVIALVGILLAILFLRYIIERIFRHRLKHTSPDERVIKMYGRLVKISERRYKVNLSAFTPDMFNSFTFEKTGLEITHLVKTFEKVCYGNKNITAEDLAKCFIEYKQIYEITELRKKQSK